MDPMMFAIPVFAVSMAAEAAITRRYVLEYAVSDVVCGLLQQAIGAPAKLLVGAGYLLAYDTLRVTTWDPASPLTWVVAFVLADLAFYGWHRWSHRMNIGWAAHVVHHQREDFNLAVALRQSGSNALTSLPFYGPLAIVGIPLSVTFVCIAASVMYQFFLHTELIRTLGPLEWVLNTPSHHRVHHARNPGYLDRNYGGTFIVWDRLFGSFARESEPCEYGSVHRFVSVDPVHANLWYPLLLIRRSLSSKGGLWLWLRAPAALELEEAPTPSWSPTRGPRSVYIFGQFWVLVGLLYGLLVSMPSPSPAELVGYPLLIALGGTALAGLATQRPAAVGVEAVRLGLTSVFVALLYPTFALGTAGFAAVSLGGVAYAFRPPRRA